MTDFKRNKFNSIIVAFATIIAILLALHNSSFAESVSKIHIVEIRDLEFIPKVIHAKPGDTVQWINQDFIAHTATADDESWNSELIDVKGNWQMDISKETPEDYYCVFHPNMKGKIIVIN